MYSHIHLYDKIGRLVASGEVPTVLLDASTLRFRNVTYKRLPRSHGGSIHFSEVPEPVNIDDLLQET